MLTRWYFKAVMCFGAPQHMPILFSPCYFSSMIFTSKSLMAPAHNIGRSSAFYIFMCRIFYFISMMIWFWLRKKADYLFHSLRLLYALVKKGSMKRCWSHKEVIVLYSSLFLWWLLLCYFKIDANSAEILLSGRFSPPPAFLRQLTLYFSCGALYRHYRHDDFIWAAIF